MGLSVIPFLLILSVIQSAAPVETTECTEFQYIELSRLPDKPIEVCVSPHLLTGFSFEAPVSVDVQDEPRFEEVTRGRTSLHVLPPRDMLAGERLRLSVTYLDRKSSEPFFLVLVGTSAQSTRQVKISRTQRSRESLEEEIKLERMKGQLIQDELARLRQEFQQLRGERQDDGKLTGLISSQSMYATGIKGRQSTKPYQQPGSGEFWMTQWSCYSSRNRIAIDIMLGCRGPEPWLAVTAEARDGNGHPMRVVSLWQHEPIPMGNVRQLIVELVNPEGRTSGEITLRLRETGAREALLTGISCP